MLTLVFWVSSLIICSWCLWLMSLITTEDISTVIPMFLITTIIGSSMMLLYSVAVLLGV